MSWLMDNANSIGLIFFFCFFVGMAVYVLRPSKKAEIEAHGHIPLRDEDEHE